MHLGLIWNSPLKYEMELLTVCLPMKCFVLIWMRNSHELWFVQRCIIYTPLEPFNGSNMKQAKQNHPYWKGAVDMYPKIKTHDSRADKQTRNVLKCIIFGGERIWKIGEAECWFDWHRGQPIGRQWVSSYALFKTFPLQRETRTTRGREACGRSASAADLKTRSRSREFLTSLRDTGRTS